MGSLTFNLKQICFLIKIQSLLVLVMWALLSFSVTADHHHHDECNHGHEHEYHDGGFDDVDVVMKRSLLPEELAEEEDLKMYGFGAHHHHHHHHLPDSELSGLGLWTHAMGCSLLVSLASLICLILLPFIFIQGKPTKAFVDSLALFGAGAMLGDAFLHQLPHAFGGEHSHVHDHQMDHPNDHGSHAHSLKDLSVGLSVLAGIVLFLIVEKVVRYVEDQSGTHGLHHHHHHHHHHKNSRKKNVDADSNENHQLLSHDDNDESSENISEGEVLNGKSSDAPDGVKQPQPAVIRKRLKGNGGSEEKAVIDNSSSTNNAVDSTEEVSEKSPSNLVFGYLNLFSDGVHNFTDGMALGSAFLLYGSIGGWSRTLFLLAHELPQEIGDFGILVRSGFSIPKALFFNFLSALMALAGTALALIWGKDPGQSSLIEGFTAGGFIYIAVAGVLAEMNNDHTTFRSSVIQLISLTLGMGVALCISLVE
ncbi:primary active transporter [Lithospermum erythrorhizon]|uniref:Primary active transporter n=1 Tax=Lithospermum erythrorhizon TaxID=34254 RepID=A0AAV3RD71_LITER